LIYLCMSSLRADDCLLRWSYWIWMSFSISVVLSFTVSPPINVEYNNGGTDCILIGYLCFPGFILSWPDNFAIIRKFGFISRFEFLLENLLLSLYDSIFIVTSPVIEVVVVESECFYSRCSQHNYYILSSNHIKFKQINEDNEIPKYFEELSI
jgi:hypothetical protein